MSMRLIGLRRRHGRAWWGVLGAALLILGVHIAFDLLDLDGSELSSRPAGDAQAAELNPGDTDRLVPESFAGQVASDSVPPLAPPSFAGPLRATPRGIPEVSPGREHHRLPRAQLTRVARDTNSQTTDPN